MKQKQRETLRAFAKRHKVAHSAVNKAVKSGRLSKSIGVEKGRPFIADPELADAEWPNNSQPQTKTNVIPTETLVEAQRSATLERSRKLRFENDLRAGQLVELVKATRVQFECFRTLRKAIQNIPSRMSAELAAESDQKKVFTKLDAALREALNSVADTLMAASE